MKIKKLIEVLQHHQDADLYLSASDMDGEDCIYEIGGVNLELDAEGGTWRVILIQGKIV